MRAALARDLKMARSKAREAKEKAADAVSKAGGGRPRAARRQEHRRVRAEEDDGTGATAGATDEFI